MNLFNAVLVIFSLLLFVLYCQGAPNRLGRQLNIPDSETAGGEVEITNRGETKGFLQTIFDMIRSLLGLNDTTIIREDGTIEEVNDNDGFLMKIGKRILRMISSLVGMITGGGSNIRLDFQNFPRFSKVSPDAIERELLTLDKSKSK